MENSLGTLGACDVVSKNKIKVIHAVFKVKYRSDGIVAFSVG